MNEYAIRKCIISRILRKTDELVFNSAQIRRLGTLLNGAKLQEVGPDGLIRRMLIFLNV